MENVYFLMIIALAVLAIADLVVGVSNDAVNFLNSAIGSKAISFKTIMIVASLGVGFGAIFSSGMMEVARKGIFNPSEFMFDEIMYIFMAVMITDILLLDFFNTVGMPTSTTVSIVFELLGAAVAIALIKIGANDGNFTDVINYINTSKATQIIFGILLSVFVAFTIGALVQWIARLFLSFNFEKKSNWIGAVFGGVALASITYFILIKGVKGTAYADMGLDILGGATINQYSEANTYLIIIVSTLFWVLLSFALIKFFKINIYKVIIGVGTFALALAFAGNDLVNFIGVPIAAWQSYNAWIDPLINVNGLSASEFPMGFLANKVPTPTLLLFLSGLIMVLTLWFSSKAKSVVKTSLDLSSQGDTKERFQPNFLSRGFVQVAMGVGKLTTYVLPASLQAKIDKQFEKPYIPISKKKNYDLPSFDMVRAAVNLMIASVLISVATSYKLPLSTTYVTFMVAMGTSLADKAWGSESAVYRVAGVLNVIGGWFFTAFIAFTAAAVVAYLIHLGGATSIAILLMVVLFLLVRNYMSHKKQAKEEKAEDRLMRAESQSIQGVIHESAGNISNVVKRGNKIYSNTMDGLSRQDTAKLKKSKKGISKLDNEINELRDNIFYFIKNLDESSIGASQFYIQMLGYLQDMTQSLEYIATAGHKHVNNKHKNLRFNQIKDLKEIDDQLSLLFTEIEDTFNSQKFSNIAKLIDKKHELFKNVELKIDKQISRTRTEESSPKNTALYFSLLLETKDLIVATMNLLEIYYKHANPKKS